MKSGVKSFIESFVKGTLGNKTKLGNYTVEDFGRKLVYTAYSNAGKRKDGIDVLAVKLKSGAVLGNAARMEYCGTKMAWGSRTSNWRNQTVAQQTIEAAGARMIAFNAIEQCGLSLDHIEVVEQGQSEQVIVWNDLNTWQVPGVVKRALTGKPDKTEHVVREGDKNLGTAHDSDEPVDIDSLGTYRTTKDEDGSNEVFQKMEKRHFIGGCLFKSLTHDESGNPRYAFMLFDIDRVEIEHGVFNPFIAEVQVDKRYHAPSTIAQAYEMLKPQAVKDAESEGLKVLRQGEWFFIPTDEVKEVPKPDENTFRGAMFAPDPLGFFGLTKEQLPLNEDESPLAMPANPHLQRAVRRVLGFTDKTHDLIEKYDEAVKKYNECRDIILGYAQNQALAGQLQAGDNRPNTVEKYLKRGEDIFVSGKVEHTGREHHPIVLKGWYKAVPNTAIKSFQVSGDID